jgi:FKBP-type peptidyl-prolyl cis-trans isomerase FkpA
LITTEDSQRTDHGSLVGAMPRILKIIGVILLTALPGCRSDKGRDGPPQLPPMTDSGITALQKTDVTPGSGAEARSGMTVRVHYTGWLFDPATADRKGKQFDSSRDSGQPFEFQLGKGEVIAGWDEGIAGMKVGGTRMLTIPPAMAYGPNTVGNLIPPNATLFFEVELLGVR